MNSHNMEDHTQPVAGLLVPFTLVSGCPRSGTSALAAWLKEQPTVAGFSETRILIAAHAFLREVRKFKALHTRQEQLLTEVSGTVYRSYGNPQKPWKHMVVDKGPLDPLAFPGGDYESFLQSVELLFPKVKIVFMIRNPISTIWSMRNRKWGVSLVEGSPVELSLPDCVDIWRSNARLIHQHRCKERVYICRFEELVADPNNESRRILKALGLAPGRPFQPVKTTSPEFTPSELDQILKATIIERSMLGY